MRLRINLVNFAIAVLFMGPVLVLPRPTFAQDAAAPAPASDNAKRKIKTRVSPEYPELAKRMNVTGHVKIEVTISIDGKVTSTKVIGGNPVLVSASIEALKKWHFDPGPKQTSEIIEFEFNGQN